MLSIGQTFPGAAMTVSKKLRWALFAFAAGLGGCYQPNLTTYRPCDTLPCGVRILDPRYRVRKYQAWEALR